ncbi:MAG: HTH domain-containing protein [Oscillospiraceae bacterium]
MSKTHTMKSEAIEALTELGGKAHISEIIKLIIKRNNLSFSGSKTPKDSLSAVLQRNSKSVDYGKENIFYSVYGTAARKGFWGLVGYNVKKHNNN